MVSMDERDARALGYLALVAKRRRVKWFYWLTGVSMVPLVISMGIVLYTLFWGWPFQYVVFLMREVVVVGLGELDADDVFVEVVYANIEEYEDKVLQSDEQRVHFESLGVLGV